MSGNMAGPEGHCGFTLDPEDADVDLDEDSRFNDLDDWYSSLSAVCCWQESWEEADTDRCVWHAELARKSAADLSEPPTRPERLDGAVLREAELGDALGFADCSLLGADLSGAGLVGTTLSGANLRKADLSDNMDLTRLPVDPVHNA